jgi:hypothetical protein
MARRKAVAQRPAQEPTRYPLLVYYNLGRRYRPVGILLMFLGLFLFFPSFISELENDLVEPEALAGVGAGIFVVGLAFTIFARLARRQAYVQCDPEALVIRAPFYRTVMSYRRVKVVHPVQVSQLYPKDSLKGMGKPLVRPLLAMTAVEVQVKSWPAPKKRLVRYFGKYLFSPRAEAWLFIVPNYSSLIRHLDSTMQRKAEAERGGASDYQDPFERIRYQQG